MSHLKQFNAAAMTDGVIDPEQLNAFVALLNDPEALDNYILEIDSREQAADLLAFLNALTAQKNAPAQSRQENVNLVADFLSKPFAIYELVWNGLGKECIDLMESDIFTEEQKRKMKEAPNALFALHNKGITRAANYAKINFDA